MTTVTWWRRSRSASPASTATPAPCASSIRSRPDLAATRCNDGRPDRHGGFVFGTMDEQNDPRQPLGSFYHWDVERGPTVDPSRRRDRQRAVLLARRTDDLLRRLAARHDLAGALRPGTGHLARRARVRRPRSRRPRRHRITGRLGGRRERLHLERTVGRVGHRPLHARRRPRHDHRRPRAAAERGHVRRRRSRHALHHDGPRAHVARAIRATSCRVRCSPSRPVSPASPTRQCGSEPPSAIRGLTLPVQEGPC